MPAAATKLYVFWALCWIVSVQLPLHTPHGRSSGANAISSSEIRRPPASAFITRYDKYGKAIDSIALDALNPFIEPLHPGDDTQVKNLPAPARAVITATFSVLSTGTGGKACTLTDPAAVE